MKKKTIIRLSITLIVIAALALWINSRWAHGSTTKQNFLMHRSQNPDEYYSLSAMKTNCRAISAGSTTL